MCVVCMRRIYVTVYYVHLSVHVHTCLYIGKQAGKYYLFSGGAENNCPFAPCSNAAFGQKYTPGHAVAKNNCSKEDCPHKPPPGFRFATAGSCALIKCAIPTRGTYYTDGCEVAPCTNGNARFVRS